MEDFGEGISSQSEKIQEFIDFITKRVGITEPLTFLCLYIEMTNYEDQILHPYISNHTSVYTWKNSGEKRFVDSVMACTEIFYDSPAKSGTSPKDYYRITIQPGETITARCVSIVYEEKLEKELYMLLEFDNRKDVSKENSYTRFLKLPPVEKIG